ncbi:hypothetical protein LTR95_012541 [Oleoguttula sp. CCFEE 5521]
MTDASEGQLDEPSVRRPSTEGVQNEGILLPIVALQHRSSMRKEDRAVECEIKNEVTGDQVVVKHEVIMREDRAVTTIERVPIKNEVIHYPVIVKQEPVERGSRAAMVEPVRIKEEVIGDSVFVKREAVDEFTSVKLEAAEDLARAGAARSAGESTSGREEVVGDLARAGMTKNEWGVLSRPPCKTCHTVHFNACDGPQTMVKRKREESLKLEEDDDRTFKRQFAIQRSAQTGGLREIGPPRQLFCRRCGCAHPWRQHIKREAPATLPRPRTYASTRELRGPADTLAAPTAGVRDDETQESTTMSVPDMVMDLSRNVRSQAHLQFLVRFVQYGDDIQRQEALRQWRQVMSAQALSASSEYVQPTQSIRTVGAGRGERGNRRTRRGHGRGHCGFTAAGGSTRSLHGAHGGMGGRPATPQVDWEVSVVGSGAQSSAANDAAW